MIFLASSNGHALLSAAAESKAGLRSRMFDPAMVLFPKLLPAQIIRRSQIIRKRRGRSRFLQPVSRRAGLGRQRAQRFFLAALGARSYLRSPFKEQRMPSPTPHEALIYLMVITSASDRDMTDVQLPRI